MRTQFSTFSVIAHTVNTLTVRMNSGTEYTLLRGLDQNYRRLFKLQLGKEFSVHHESQESTPAVNPLINLCK